MSIVISIDPSINFCGFAVYQDAKLVKGILLTSPNEGDYIERGRFVFNRIKSFYSELNADVLVLEVPEHWGVAGYLSRESGSLFKLTFFCGMVASLDNVVTVNPSKWKGQHNKEVTLNRMKKVYPEHVNDKLNHNIVDAIAIGHWYHVEYLAQNMKDKNIIHKG